MIIDDLEEDKVEVDKAIEYLKDFDIDNFHLYDKYSDFIKTIPNGTKVIKDTQVDCEAYIVGLNFTITMGYYTNYKEIKDSTYYFPLYGVADNLEQIINKHSEELDKDSNYIILMTPMDRREQPSRDGWRWHKWGEYIGVQEPQCEYLYDEKDIDLVYVYKIVEVTKKKEG